MELKYLIGLGTYFILLILIGLWVKGKINTTEDYLVGGRSFNTFFNTATLTSCGFSMESLAFTGEDWYLYTLGAPVACILTIVAVSLATQKIDPPIEVKEYSSVTEHQAF